MKRILLKVKSNRMLNNFIVLLTGEGVSSILSMVSLMIIVNAIGLEANGMIISIQTYCLLLNNIFAFKSFQALIKYMSSSLETKNMSKVKDYILQSYILDIVAVLISTVFSFIFLEFYAKFMNWDYRLIDYAKIFIIASMFQIQGTPIGVLRSFNKFNLITYNNVATAFLRLILYVAGVLAKAEFTYYFYVEAALIVIPNIILNYFTYKTLKAERLSDFYKCKLKIEKDFFMFNFYSNISSTIDIPVGTLTTVIINKYLGYTNISIYRIFEKIGSMVGKLGSPLGQIIYPEMNICIAKKKYKNAKKINDKLFIGISLMGVVIITFTALTYKFWLGIFIENYDAYIGALLFYLVFVVFVNATVGVHSLFMALNYIKFTIPILLVVNLCYLGVVYAVIAKFQLMGVIASLLIQAVAVVAIKMIMIKKGNYKEYEEKVA